jgi:hypothetical protein
MGSLRVLLGVDRRQALEFFVVGLQDVCTEHVDRQELLYNASVLAHWAQVSTQSDTEMPAPTDLGDLFDRFVLDTTLSADGPMMENAGAQCLLLAGFFEDQMRVRRNIRWYSELGAGFFSRAAACEPSLQKARLLKTLARHFEVWRRRHARLSRELRVQPFLLAPSIRSDPGSAPPEA